MPRFFFDVHTGEWSRDQTGTELDTIENAIVQAKRLLPAIAIDRSPWEGNHHTVMVLVCDEERRPIYKAALTFSGLVLSR